MDAFVYQPPHLSLPHPPHVPKSMGPYACGAPSPSPSHPSPPSSSGQGSPSSSVASFHTASSSSAFYPLAFHSAEDLLTTSAAPAPHEEPHAPEEHVPAPASTQSFADAFKAQYGTLSRPLTTREHELLQHLDRLKFFLATAPSRWGGSVDVADAAADGYPSSALPFGHPHANHPALNRFLLPNSEYVSCVLWNGLYHITGTDIVRALVFRFEAFGRPVRNMKKFEEGVFSDLRNLKPGQDACLEEPKSPFLDLLFKYQCIRTQKKQKVFFWFSVPHDRLFLDALERDLKRERMGHEPTTVLQGEPALSFKYDPKRPLYEQFSKNQNGDNDDDADDSDARPDTEDSAPPSASSNSDEDERAPHGRGRSTTVRQSHIVPASAAQAPGSAFFDMFTLFEGSPTYKQRRKRNAAPGLKPSALSGRRDPLSPEDGLVKNEYGAGLGLVGFGYGVGDADVGAAEMFARQASGELGPRMEREREMERERRAREERLARQDAAAQLAQERSRHMRSFGAPDYSMALPVSGMPVDYDFARQPERHGSYPLVSPPSSAGPYQKSFFPSPAASLPPFSFGPEVAPVHEVPEVQPPQPKTKAFVCPLLSCGRLFKRMEHLKRHLRTHTLERPFACTTCGKRFSRSDNLAQHLRTHSRGNPGQEDEDDGQADGESEASEKYFPQDFTVPAPEMCEVEVPGEVPDDDAGMLASITGAQAFSEEPQDAYFPPATNGYTQLAPIVTSRDALSYDQPPSAAGSWGAFGAGSPASGHYRHVSAGSFDEYSSLSAPSHKATFDHSALYPPAAGPVRRHRSVTPSLSKSFDNLRRGSASASSDGGSSRGYHPYALAAYGAPGSAHSSPGNGSDGLPLAVARTLSHSRSTSSLRDGFGTILTFDRDAEEANAYGLNAYETAPAAPFDPTAFHHDSPQAEPALYDPRTVYGAPDPGYYAFAAQTQHVQM